MGGTFEIQNKVLPGSYVKFVSTVAANASLSERGIAAVLLPTNWNPDSLLTVTAQDLANAKALFGLAPESEELRPLREVFCKCSRALVYTVGGGETATSEIGRARCPGSFGNRISVRVSQNPDWTAANMKMDIITLVDGVEADRQIGVNATVLVGEIRDNDYVCFDTMAVLDRPCTHTFSGGTSETVTVAHYQKGLDALETESFHSIAYDGADASVCALFSNYTRRMREECGAMFQCVLYDTSAAYRGVVDAYDRDSVWWIAGALAGCGLNESLTNTVYNGECALTYPATASEMEDAVKGRKFAFYNAGGVLKVLRDQNSEADVLFGENQALRVLDQIANDVAVLFSTQYLGKIQNNRAGRMSFWNDTVHLLGQLAILGAIDEFSAQDVTVEEGAEKTAITVTAQIRPVCSMEKLYLTVTVV